MLSSKLELKNSLIVKKNSRKDFNASKNDVHRNYEKPYRKFDDRSKIDNKKRI